MTDTDELAAAIRRDQCPDCKAQGQLIPGPCGAASMNVTCGACGARFNAHGANLGGKRDVRLTFMVDRLPSATELRTELRKTRTVQAAWDAGWDAREAGKRKDENPCEIGTWERVNWDMGYDFRDRMLRAGQDTL